MLRFSLTSSKKPSRRGHVFRLSDEQRASLQQLSRASLVAIEGLPGVGKTTIQGAVRVLGEQLGRKVVGLTLSQAAAERLEAEAGFRCVNTARARMLEEGNNPVIPHNGIVVVDEAAMVDSRANGKILELARARKCCGGDWRCTPIATDRFRRFIPNRQRCGAGRWDVLRASRYPAAGARMAS